MNETTLKPIKIMVILSFALHIAGLAAAVIVTFFQVPLGEIFAYRHPDEIIFVLPSALLTIQIVAVFAMHLLLTIGFWRAINGEKPGLRTMSILGFIFILAVVPLLFGIVPIFDNLFASFNGINYLVAYNILQTLLSFALTLRGFGFSAMLIAASMAFYRCYILKRKALALDEQTKALEN